MPDVAMLHLLSFYAVVVQGLGFLTGSAGSRLPRGGDDIVITSTVGRSGEDAEGGAGAGTDKTTGAVIGGSSCSTRRRLEGADEKKQLIFDFDIEIVTRFFSSHLVLIVPIVETQD